MVLERRGKETEGIVWVDECCDLSDVGMLCVPPELLVRMVVRTCVDQIMLVVGVVLVLLLSMTLS